ncbi:hypothetical protein [Nocardia sp. NPDC005998]|uniref:hypothetical protein n=1 Tax=Nocardia sp. NPDC005998 TaxID=3156894 RepID=UPI0033BA7E27
MIFFESVHAEIGLLKTLLRAATAQVTTAARGGDPGRSGGRDHAVSAGPTP